MTRLFCIPSLVLIAAALADPAAAQEQAAPKIYKAVCKSLSAGADYVPETASSIPVTSAYAKEREADKGQIHLMNKGGRRVKDYAIPRHQIRGIVHVTPDGNDIDKVDLVFTARGLTLVYTGTANGGIFTYSDVYLLQRRPGGRINRHLLEDAAFLGPMLDFGLQFYQSHEPRCTI